MGMIKEGANAENAQDGYGSIEIKRCPKCACTVGDCKFCVGAHNQSRIWGARCRGLAAIFSAHAVGQR